jgi:hypothetical protein
VNRHKSFLFVPLALALCLGSCSGVPQNTPPPPVTGSTALSLTLQALPVTPPSSVSFLSFSVDVTGISLTPASGSPVTVPLNASSYTVDLTKLQSDSVFLGTSSTVPPGSYTAVTVSFSNPVLWYCIPSAQTNVGCPAGSVAQVSGGGTAPSITTSLTLATNQQTGLAIQFNLNNAITLGTGNVPAVSLAASNVLTAVALPSASNSLGAGELDFVEDVTGIVTAVNASAQTVTVQTGTRGSITAAANSTTVFPSSSCTTSQSFTCIQQGQVASIDTALNAAGTFTLLEYDPLTGPAGDWIEGLVTTTPGSSTQFQIVANDLVVASSGSLIGSSANALVGVPVQVTLASNVNPFVVDSRRLTVPVNNFTGTDATILLPGQTVAVHVTGLTAGSGTASTGVTADTVILRFTRVTGQAGVVSFPTFSVTNLPPLFGITTPALVQLSSGSPSTNYDGVTSGTGLSTGEDVEIRALYFGPSSATPFSAAKVRVPFP